jgi:hypothetical protein
MYYSVNQHEMDVRKAEGYFSLGLAEKSRILLQFANEKRVLQKEKNQKKNKRLYNVIPAEQKKN